MEKNLLRATNERTLWRAIAHITHDLQKYNKERKRGFFFNKPDVLKSILSFI